MFELMDTTNDRVTIQVIGLGEKGQLLCNYIEKKRLEGVQYHTEIKQYSNANTSLNLTLAIEAEREFGNPSIRASELNFYLVSENDLPDKIDELQQYVDSSCLNCLVIINHKSLMETGSEKVKNFIKQVDFFLLLPVVFSQDNDASSIINPNKKAYWFVQCLSETINRPGLVCIDFADVYVVMSKIGLVEMRSFSARGKNRAINAVKHIVSEPLFNYILSHTRGYFINLTGGIDMTLNELEEVSNSFKVITGDNVMSITTSVINQNMFGEVRVTVIAAGVTEII